MNFESIDLTIPKGFKNQSVRWVDLYRAQKYELDYEICLPLTFAVAKYKIPAIKFFGITFRKLKTFETPVLILMRKK